MSTTGVYRNYCDLAPITLASLLFGRAWLLYCAPLYKGHPTSYFFYLSLVYLIYLVQDTVLCTAVRTAVSGKAHELESSTVDWSWRPACCYNRALIDNSYMIWSDTILYYFT